MANGNIVKDNLVNLIAKIGEKITIRRTDFFDNVKGLIFIMFIQQLKKILEKSFQSSSLME